MKKHLTFDILKIFLMSLTCLSIFFYSIESYNQRAAIKNVIENKTEDRYKATDAKRDFIVRDNAIENLDKRLKKLESSKS